MDLPVFNWYSIYASSKKLKKLYILPYNLKITACIYGIQSHFYTLQLYKIGDDVVMFIHFLNGLTQKMNKFILARLQVVTLQNEFIQLNFYTLNTRKNAN